MSNYTSQRRMPSAAEREARRVFRDPDPKAALSEYERAQLAFHANRERLKAERLAREAALNREAGRKSKT
jgi:hypothetical protein